MHKIILRDDDTNFFTPSNLLEKFINLKPAAATMVLGVVPWVRPSVCGCIPSHYWPDSGNCFDIADNPSLVALLKELVKDRQVAIALHGVEHHYFHVSGKFVPEFQLKRFSQEQVIRAKEHLESTLECKVEFFIPPSNKINKHNYEIVSRLFPYLFNVPSRGSLSRPLAVRHLKRWAKRLATGNNLAAEGVFRQTGLAAEIPSIDFQVNSHADIEQVTNFGTSSTFGLASHYWEVVVEDGIGRENIYREKLSRLENSGVGFWSEGEEI